MQEFRLLLSPLVTHAVIDGFTRDINIGAEREWSNTLAKHASSSGSKSTPPSKWLVPPSTQSLPALSSISIPPTNAAHTPPQVLTTFTLLAITLNTYLRALNRLRALAPMGALDGARHALESGLAQNGETLLRYARVWQDDGAEREVMRAAGTAFIRVLVPFLRRAIVEGVFGVACDPEGGTGSLGDTVRNWEGWLSETS